MSSWAPGEYERAQLFQALRSSRLAERARIEAELGPASLAPYLALQENFEPLLRATLQAQLPPEDDATLFPESEIVVNQNIW
jgi:hypothetical protein